MVEYISGFYETLSSISSTLGTPEAGLHSCELPNMGPGNITQVSQEQYTLLATEPPLLPTMHCENYI